MRLLVAVLIYTFATLLPVPNQGVQPPPPSSTPLRLHGQFIFNWELQWCTNLLTAHTDRFPVTWTTNVPVWSTAQYGVDYGLDGNQIVLTNLKDFPACYFRIVIK